MYALVIDVDETNWTPTKASCFERSSRPEHGICKTLQDQSHQKFANLLWFLNTRGNWILMNRFQITRRTGDENLHLSEFKGARLTRMLTTRAYLHKSWNRWKKKRMMDRSMDTKLGIDVKQERESARMGQLMSRCPRRRSVETNQRPSIRPRPNDTCRLKSHDIQQPGR